MKLGEVLMDSELLNARIDRLEAGAPFAARRSNAAASTASVAERISGPMPSPGRQRMRIRPYLSGQGRSASDCSTPEGKFRFSA